MARKKKKSRPSKTAQRKQVFAAFLLDVLSGIISTVLGALILELLSSL